MVMRPVRYVTLQAFFVLTGYTVKASERKIESGVWTEGREYRRGPDGRVLVDLVGYEKWVETGRA